MRHVHGEHSDSTLCLDPVRSAKGDTRNQDGSDMHDGEESDHLRRTSEHDVVVFKVLHKQPSAHKQSSNTDLRIKDSSHVAIKVLSSVVGGHGGGRREIRVIAMPGQHLITDLFGRTTGCSQVEALLGNLTQYCVGKPFYSFDLDNLELHEDINVECHNLLTLMANAGAVFSKQSA